MGHWHEPAKNIGGWTFLPKPGSRVGVIFEGESVRIAPHVGHFIRYEGDQDIKASLFPIWRKNPEGWFELWPREPLTASSSEEAKSKVAPLLPQIEDGSIDDQFEKRPYRPPVPPKLVKEIEHPTHIVKAVIVQNAEGRYQALYRVYAPDGKYIPVSTPSIGELGWEWGRARTETNTFADDLKSAEEIAIAELSEVVRQDPEIKRR